MTTPKKHETGLDKAKKIAALTCLAIAALTVAGVYIAGFVREQSGADQKPLPEKGSVVTVKGQTQQRFISALRKDETQHEASGPEEPKK